MLVCLLQASVLEHGSVRSCKISSIRTLWDVPMSWVVLVCMCMDVSLRSYGHCAASLWLELTLKLALILRDRTAVQNSMLFTHSGWRDVISKHTIVQGRGVNCSCSYGIKRKIANAVTVEDVLGKWTRVDISCVFFGHSEGHSRTAQWSLRRPGLWLHSYMDSLVSWRTLYHKPKWRAV